MALIYYYEESAVSFFGSCPFSLVSFSKIPNMFFVLQIRHAMLIYSLVLILSFRTIIISKLNIYL